MGAHAGGAVADALLDGARGALGHVLDGEGVLDGRHTLHREVRDALGLVLAARQDARLVEMDVGLDEAGADQPAAALHLVLGAAAELRRDRGDAAVLHADVGGRLIRLAVGKPHIAQDEIEIHRKSLSYWRAGTHVAPCRPAFIVECTGGSANSMLSRRQLLTRCRLGGAERRAARRRPWPTEPIRWIVNFPPAGAADIMSRALAEWFGTKLGQPIVVENKPGAGGMLGADIVAKARGDTHLVMISSAASHGIGPVLYKDVPYDPLADFMHIHLVGTFPSVLAVNAASPIIQRGAADRPRRAPSPARSPTAQAATAP